MLKYIAGRVVAMIITLFLIVSISFFVIRLMPQNIFDNPDLPQIGRASCRERV